MAQVRVFNPAYTPRSFFAGDEESGKRGGKSIMAHHHKRYHHHRRHNPLGISGAVIKDAAFTTVGAIGSAYLAGLVGQSGWIDVAVTALAGWAVALGGKMVLGAPASDELLKGGIVMTIIKALKNAGIAAPGLSSYVPSYFSVPTASDYYGRVPSPFMQLPAPQAGGTKQTSGGGFAAGGGGLGAGPVGIPYARYRTRFMTRF